MLENPMWAIALSVCIGAFLGIMTMALISAERYSKYHARVHELEHEIKQLKQRGRKPHPKKKPVRRRDA